MIGDVEIGTCSFCQKEKYVSRAFIKPSKYIQPVDIKERSKLHNEGNYFVILWYCNDCGKPQI